MLKFVNLNTLRKYSFSKLLLLRSENLGSEVISAIDWEFDRRLPHMNQLRRREIQGKQRKIRRSGMLSAYKYKRG